MKIALGTKEKTSSHPPSLSPNFARCCALGFAPDDSICYQYLAGSLRMERKIGTMGRAQPLQVMNGTPGASAPRLILKLMLQQSS